MTFSSADIAALEIEVETKSYTVEEIFNALAANGLEHLRSEWISTSDDKVIGGCALGQAAYNLGVPPNEDYNYEHGNLYTALLEFPATETRWLTDRAYLSADLPSAPEGEYANFEAPSIGQVIICWNDARKMDADGNAIIIAGHYVYELETYQEVVDMAREVMQPYFAETVKLPHYSY